MKALGGIHASIPGHPALPPRRRPVAMQPSMTIEPDAKEPPDWEVFL